MSASKFVRLLKNSLHMYSVYFKKNLYLTITIAVSLLLFLSVALFMDYKYANVEKSYSRIQDNYIVVSTDDSGKLNTLKDALNAYNFVIQYHVFGTGYIENDSNSVDIDYNIIASNKFYSNLWLNSGLNDGLDLSNSYGYEKYSLIYGRDIFYSPFEIVVSKTYAALLAEDPQDSLGKQITMGINGPDQIFTIVGIYDDTLSETRMNKVVFDCLKANQPPKDTLVFTVFTSEELFEYDKNISANVYVFFNNDVECNNISDALIELNSSSDADNLKYPYIKPIDKLNELKIEYASSTILKSIMMIVVSVISGISVFGTMQNSISDRKREIGIKKALGASNSDIMLSFLFENIITALLSILVATGLACLISEIVCFYERKILLTDFIIKIYPNTIVLFLCYSLSSILGFSLIPAYNATQVNIIDTIRTE